MALWYGGNPPEIVAAISLVCWWSIAIGLATAAMPLGRLENGAFTAIALIGGLLGLTALSVGWATDAGAAFEQTVAMASVVGIFILALLTARPGSARYWLSGIALGLTFIVVLAAFSRYFPGLGTDAELGELATRLSWPIGYWNALGACAAVAFIANSHFAADAEDPRWRAASAASLPILVLALYLTSSRGAIASLAAGLVILFAFERKRIRLAAPMAAGLAAGVVLAVIAAQMFALVHAHTDSDARAEGLVLLGCTALATALVGLSVARFDRQIRRLGGVRAPRWTSIAALLALCAIVIAADPVSRIESFTSPVTNDASDAPPASSSSNAEHLLSTSGTGRWQLWSNAFEAFEDHPALGLGAGGFQDYFFQHRDAYVPGRHAHSLVLQDLAELGLVGLVLLAAFALVIVATAWRRWQAGLLSGRLGARGRRGPPPPWTAIGPLLAIAGAAAANMSIDWTYEFPIVYGPALMAMAALVGPATRSAASARTTEATRQDPVLAVVSAIFILVAGGAIWASAVKYGSTVDLDSSRAAVGDGDLPLAASRAREAIDKVPWSAEPRVQLAQVQELQGNYRDALATAAGAIDRSRLNSGYWLLKWRIERELGKRAAARASLARARDLDPESPGFQ